MPDTDVVVAESSAATGTQFDTWDKDGTPIVSKKPDVKAESSTAAEPAKEVHSEPEGKSAAESEPAKPQEKVRKPGEKKSAEERIAELTAELKTLRGDLERSKSQRATEPAKEPEKKADQPSNYVEWRKAFKPREWIEKWTKDNPTATYEDAVSALADYQSEIRDKYRQLEEAVKVGRERANQQLKKTLEKYPDAEPKIRETAKALNAMPEELRFVRFFIDDSEVMTDLLYTLSDPATLDNLLETAKTRPGKALRVLRDMELEITKAVSAPEKKIEGKSETDKPKETPAEPKPRAPKPPPEVGGRGTAAVDEEEAAARANDYKRQEAAMNRRYFSR